MKKLAIIGASYLQEPLISKAKENGLETHVFAWQCGDIGERIADFFYPISIVEKDEILAKCREIQIDGICTIASDLAVITVNYVAEKMGLPGNSMECTNQSTNKHAMRLCFEEKGDPSPKSRQVSSVADIKAVELEYPVIVKPVDRSGSRGITKVFCEQELESAIENAKRQGFEKKALVEEFAKGQEYSVECISQHGRHTFLAMTKKYTTGSPNFVETGHLQPAPISKDLLEKVKQVVFHALTSLAIKNGASHSEIKISSNKEIKIIEIGGRMGGDFIGSHLVKLTTGFDFVQAVIDVALNNSLEICVKKEENAAVRFIFTKKDLEILKNAEKDPNINIIQKEIHEITNQEVVDSGSRFGYFLFSAENIEALEKYMPEGGKDEK